MLLVDDNRDLLHFLERLMADAGWTLLTAESATEAKRLVQLHKPNAALLDYMLPDGNGVELYWDRPPEQWPRTANGELAMFTHALDLDALLSEAPSH